MGRWSLDKLRTKGPSATYRVQLHTYAYGARQRGEKVERIALVAWPREGASLDDLYVWEEPYDPAIARDALHRVEELHRWATDGGLSAAEAIKAAKVADDCRFCDFHAPGDIRGSIGCNGKQ
jgi:hypothetical protein